MSEILSWPDHLVPRVSEMLAHMANRAVEMNRPSFIRPVKIYPNGDQWCCLEGENIQEGVCGFGPSPDAACAAFDEAWYAKLPTGGKT